MPGLVALLLLLTACGGGMRRDLAPIGGDAFTLFPDTSDDPPPIACNGDHDARFACLSSELRDGTSGLPSDAAGALVVVVGDDAPRVFATAPVARDDRFFIASISKMFIAAAVASLSLEGRLDLTAPIATYLDELHADRGVGQANLHQLLTHTSGLGDVAQCRSLEDDLDDRVRELIDRPLWAPPGAVYNYSNVGYTMIAAVIERVTGQRFEDVVAARVLVPAGIPDATFDPSSVHRPGHASTPALPMCRAMRPSGGLALTVSELGRFAAGMLRDEPPIGRAVVDLITAPHVDTGDGATYGYGVRRIAHDGTTLLGHGGGLPGFSSFLGWDVERRIAVAAVADVPGGLPALGSFRAVSTFLDLSPRWNDDREPAHALGRYVGTYLDEIGTLGRVRIGLEDGHLTMDYVGATPPLLPVVFQFSFDADADQATRLVTAVGVATRVE